MSAENHAWFNKQSVAEQGRLNAIFQSYKLGTLELQDGEVVQAQEIKFDDTEEYISIPLEPVDKRYNRAKVKRETQEAVEQYLKGDTR